MPKPPTANDITSALLIEVPRNIPNVFLYRNNRIDTMAVGRNGKSRRVMAGIDGQGDLSGIIGPSGCRIEVEVKAEYEHGRDRQSIKQEAFQRLIEGHGGIYILVERVGWGEDRRPDLTAALEMISKAVDGRGI